MSLASGSRKCVEKLVGEKVLDSKRFARQQWRAWIETAMAQSSRLFTLVRPPAMAGVD